MKYNLPSEVLVEIRFFAVKHGVQKIILFGSRAKGTNFERSDIGIAVYGGNFDDFYWDIKENINSLLSFDIVDANSPITKDLQDELDKYGVVIYEKT